MSIKAPSEDYEPLSRGGYLTKTPVDIRYGAGCIEFQDLSFQEAIQRAKQAGKYLCCVWTPGGATTEVVVLGSGDQSHYDMRASSRWTSFHLIPRELVPDEFFE